LRTNIDGVLSRKKNLTKFTKRFYKKLYGHKDILRQTLAMIIEEVSAIFTTILNEVFSKDITKRELRQTNNLMAKKNVGIQ
jgi:hypothetical protein